ncbi:MAG: hypothetical protein N2A42_09770 [Luteolibacter sp.]
MIQLKIFCKFTGSGILAAFLLSAQTEAAPQTWDLATGGSSYDKVNATGHAVTGSNAVFEIISGEDYPTPFWDSNNAWPDIFTTGSDTLATIFGSITGAGISWDDSKAVVAGQASFTISGNSLNWSAVPEPTGALVALLMDAGMWIWTQPRVA